ncbi:hypothetical protein RintRC_0043 [Richelia intracellularis]|nr:hypothetical protein RintRC_0043 [Richelia intracellularis]
MCQLIYPKSGSSKCFFLTCEKSGIHTQISEKQLQNILVE